MLFSSKYLLAGISVLTFLQGNLALVADNDGLERRESYERELINFDFDLDTRADIFDDDLLERRAPPKQQPRRGTQVRKETKANPYTPKNGGKSNAAPKARVPQPAHRKKGLPNAAKLTLSKDARKELDGMGLHGKARKNTIKWHKNQLKKEMRTNPALKGKARTGVIEHIAHKGGSNPKESHYSFVPRQEQERYPKQVQWRKKPPHLREQQGFGPRSQGWVGKEQRTNQRPVEISPNVCQPHPNAREEQYQGQGQAKPHKELFEDLQGFSEKSKYLATCSSFLQVQLH